MQPNSGQDFARIAFEYLRIHDILHLFPFAGAFPHLDNPIIPALQKARDAGIKIVFEIGKAVTMLEGDDLTLIASGETV
ncbi:hypothetical protein ABEV74_05585 [Paenibacillus cisolokensis]|uniref:hypothetical protein n=1 Tax=Paenibacillus cisolokensis TaxID=1658519 RepID=UPI003D2A1902